MDAMRDGCCYSLRCINYPNCNINNSFAAKIDNVHRENSHLRTIKNLLENKKYIWADFTAYLKMNQMFDVCSFYWIKNSTNDCNKGKTNNILCRTAGAVNAALPITFSKVSSWFFLIANKMQRNNSVNGRKKRIKIHEDSKYKIC